MKTILILLTAGLALLSLSCEEQDTVLAVPQFPSGGFLDQTYPIPQSARGGIQGVYSVTAGGDAFGTTVVLKWAGEKLSVFAGKNIAHMVLKTGVIDTVIVMEGYWRFGMNNSSGLVRFMISREDGGRYLYGVPGAPARIVLTGLYGDGEEAPSKAVAFTYVRPITPALLTSGYEILAHRGGGRTSDRIPASENTVEIIRIAEDYGATGIEIDVRLTKDGVPILYHDGSLNPRLTRKTPLVGGVEDYTFAQLRTAIQLLINGERIPTLQEALETVLNETNLSFVWLDTKTEDRDVVARMVPILQDILSRIPPGRRLEIRVGIPTEAVYDEFLRYPNHQQVPSLCELSTDQARTAGSQVWAPRWTAGTNDAQVIAWKAERAGNRAFVWTLDVPEYIRQFVEAGNFDGILTNYPTAVAYHYYVQQ
jgi:glycerophosphoryl diester phosphodiesterase